MPTQFTEDEKSSLKRLANIAKGLWAIGGLLVVLGGGILGAAAWIHSNISTANVALGKLEGLPDKVDGLDRRLATLEGTTGIIPEIKSSLGKLRTEQLDSVKTLTNDIADLRSSPDQLAQRAKEMASAAAELREFIANYDTLKKSFEGNDPRLFRRAIENLADLVSTSPPVLVQCHAGRSRSAVVVAGYLIKHCEMTQEEALALLAAKREIAITAGVERLLDHLFS